MTDYYKILNVKVGATETEIKKRFRKLATIHHPDKNAGSKKSEETFKIILNAYETLSDKESRAAYDFKYQQFYQQTKTDASSQKTYNKTKTEYKKQERPQYKYPPKPEYKKQEPAKAKINYTFWIIALVIVLIYIFNRNKTTTTSNVKADKQFEDQQPENRPQSGEIDFKK